MVSSVLVPMDGSELAARALTYALEIHPDATVTVLHVLGGGSPMMGEATSVALEEGTQGVGNEQSAAVFDRARQIADVHGATVETAVDYGDPADVIVEHASEFDAVVLGSHSGSLVRRLFVGNTAASVVRSSPVPVTTVR